MIKVFFLRSYDDSVAGLREKDRKKAKRAVALLLLYFDGAERPLGLRLRKLAGSFWEIRVGLDLRVLFLLDGGLATFVLVGTHDQIRRRIGS